MNRSAVGETDLEAADASIRNLSNDALIIRLIQTVNHLSRWLTPIHDRTVLEFSARRSEPSVKDLLIRLRDTETRAYAFMNAIASERDPDLDRVPRVEPSSAQVALDRSAHPLVIMSEFRRVRESSTSLLRALPDNAWERGGYSRTQRNWTIRELAEYLAGHDREMLRWIDRALSRSGAREGIAAVSQVDYARIEEPFLATVSRE
jgi:tryptophan 2,3-dioxygenase